MSSEDKIKDLFAEKLASHETSVNPELWAKISSQIATPSAVAAGGAGMSVITKSIIGIASAVVVSAGVYFIFSDEEKPQVAQQEEINKSTSSIDVTSNVEEKSVDETKSQVATIDQDEKNQSKQFTEHSTTSKINDQSKVIDLNLDREQYNSPTFVNTLYPNLIGEEPKKVEQLMRKEESVFKPRVEESTLANQETEKDKHGFEITKLPNVFVLNAAGYFSIPFKGETSDFQFTILDSKNNVIFRADHPDFEWRGMDLSGNLVEPGNYIYIITAKDNLGNSVNKYSPLTVINQ